MAPWGGKERITRYGAGRLFCEIEVAHRMELRGLTKDDFDAGITLSMYAFQYALTPEQLEEQRAQFKPEWAWGVFESGKLEAQLTIIPLHMYVQGKPYAMGGLAGVSTWPEHRRRGH